MNADGGLGCVVFAVSMIGAGVFGLAYRAYRSRVRGDGLEVSVHGRGRVVRTALGELHFDAEARTVRLTDATGTYALPYDDVVGVFCERRTENAGVEEMIFEGFGLTDLFQKYRDQLHTWEVGLRTRTGFLPILRLQQYEVRDWLDYVTPLQLGLLRLVGAYRDGADRADEHVAELRRVAEVAGLRSRR